MIREVEPASSSSVTSIQPAATMRWTNKLQIFKEEIMPVVMKQKASKYFKKPVLNGSRKFDVLIARPMDLTTIQLRLNSRFYQNLDECLDDFGLMFRNCYILCSPDTFLFKQASEFDAEIKRRVEKIPETEDNVLTNTISQCTPVTSDEVESKGSSERGTGMTVERLRKSLRVQRMNENSTTARGQGHSGKALRPRMNNAANNSPLSSSEDESVASFSKSTPLLGIPDIPSSHEAIDNSTGHCSSKSTATRNLHKNHQSYDCSRGRKQYPLNEAQVNEINDVLNELSDEDLYRLVEIASPHHQTVELVDGCLLNLYELPPACQWGIKRFVDEKIELIRVKALHDELPSNRPSSSLENEQTPHQTSPATQPPDDYNDDMSVSSSDKSDSVQPAAQATRIQKSLSELSEEVLLYDGDDDLSFDEY